MARTALTTESERFGLDVKAMRTQKAEEATLHLQNSREVFLLLVEKVRTFRNRPWCYDVFDIDGDGRLEELLVAGQDLVVLDARTGEDRWIFEGTHIQTCAVGNFLHTGSGESLFFEHGCG